MNEIVQRIPLIASSHDRSVVAKGTDPRFFAHGNFFIQLFYQLAKFFAILRDKGAFYP
jgi:hypothetical protein